MYYDAHLHLQDERLTSVAETTLSRLEQQGVGEIIVNGTSEKDWGRVADLGRYALVRPAFGLHPWQVSSRSRDWFEKLESYLNMHPDALIGEIGLDKWMKTSHLSEQIGVFEKQLVLANERNIPPTIHCLKAWGTLLEKMKHFPLQAGFLLHSYSGPVEMIESFVQLGAYFSFSGYFARTAKVEKLKLWERIPIERILVETDAPDMAPPESLMGEIVADRNGSVINSPVNIVRIYSFLAEYLGVEKETFATQIEKNYKTLFYHPEKS